MQYRRDYYPGASYFFTVVTFMRKPIFQSQQLVDNLRAAMHREMKRRPFVIDAIVIMPNHIHTVWTMPDNDVDYSIRWRNIKRDFTAHVPQQYRPEASASRKLKAEQAIWQRRFWEHRIRDEQDFIQHVDYIHYNPVKHGYVAIPNQWPHSSIHRYIQKGLLPDKWGQSPMFINDNIGRE